MNKWSPPPVYHPDTPNGTTYTLYDLQFDDDGSYVAENVMIQSRSPWSDLTPLPKNLYYDDTRYQPEPPGIA